MWQRFKLLLLGDAVETHLPERVQRAIDSQQDQSEILIGWVQLAVVTAFAVLYSVAPKTFTAEARFAPVPWALGLYLAFTVLRLALAYRRVLPRWFLALSVIIDMMLLLGLIWSFHLQYRQPAAFYLKAPTLLYVFIFIGLRALRFEARFVVLAGVAAAVGWLALVFYAVMVDPSENMITRDYVRYMTSATILLGAEFDKVISILVVTLILAVAIVRARRLLVRSVAEGAAASDLSRFFAPQIARQITASEQRIRPGEGELRDAAVLYCDVRGFTNLATRLSPGEVMGLLAEYQTRMVEVIQRHGGSIDKFLGDGIMATFGAAVKTDTYAADALRAMEDLDRSAVEWAAEREAAGKPPLEIGFAVAVGPVVFGAVGDESRLEFTVIGDSANLAAKLEKHTKVERGRALTTENSLSVAREQGYRPGSEPERIPAARIEGIEETVDVVVIAR